MAGEAAAGEGRSVSASSSPRKLFLHIGLPKTGTTFLQSALRHHEQELLDNGFCHPMLYPGSMFHGAVEMTGAHKRWGIEPKRVKGVFGRIMQAGRDSGRHVIVSHEGFGKATPQNIERMQEYFDGFEVHVVITVRDLGRTLTAGWQEWVKNGGAGTFEEYSDRLIKRVPRALEGDGTFWVIQDIEDTLRRWAAVAPPERTHVVICPQSGAPRDELWNRFAAAMGIPAGVVDVDAVERSNESLGSAQIALLRQVNGALDGRLQGPWYSRIVKHWFAQTVLSAHASRRPATPEYVAAAFQPVAQRWHDVLAQGEHRVYGDLAELEIQSASGDTVHPDDVTVEEMFDGVPASMAEMLLRIREQNVNRVEQRDRLTAEFRAQLEETEQRLRDAEAELRIRRRLLPIKLGPQRRRGA